MMDEAAIIRGLTEIFQDVFPQQTVVPTPELTAQNVPGWDSFKQIEIVMAVEERFGFKFSTRELDALRCVGDLMRTIAART